MRALVLEGGAMRGIFTAGVLDAMAEAVLPPFDLVIGVSAGAYCASSFLAGQHGRIRRIIVDHMTASNYANPWRMLKGGSLVDQDYLMGPVTRDLAPLDVDALCSAPSRFEVVSTHAVTGRPRYLPAQGDDCLAALHATVAIPFFYKGGPIRFRGEDHFDGSVSDPIPVARALELGATDVTIVLTRSPEEIPPPMSSFARRTLEYFLGDHPAIPVTIARRHQIYERAFALLDAPSAGARIHRIAPPVDFPVSRFSRDRKAILRGYEIGRCAAI